MKKLILFLAAASLFAEDVRIAGNWQMSLDTPHGAMSAVLQVKQDGAKLSGTCESDQTGSIPFTGAVDGKKISFSIDAHEQKITFNGTVDGDKMTGSTNPGGSSWTATRQSAQRSMLGTVTRFKPSSLEFGMQPDSGKEFVFKVGPETAVVQVPPGDRDLAKATPARVTNLAIGDRVLVTFVDGLSDARRVVLITAGDIARRDEAERLDWQKRGITGAVTAKHGSEITIEKRTPEGVNKIAVTVTGKTKIRQYAADSVKFADASTTSLEAIAVGDQFKARGSKSADGTSMTAEEIVFGTFLTKVGKIVAVNHGEIRIQDLATKAPLTVKLAADSQIKKMPDFRGVNMQAAPAGYHDGGPEPGMDMAQVIASLPQGRIDDLKVGGAVIVTSTRGSKNDEVTAIMVMANADPLIEMAQAQAAEKGVSPMEVLGGMHGGMLRGPGGVSLPAIIP
jgi:hypothetical protein